MPTPLIQGCINPIIKAQLILAIDEGCSGTDMSDPICTVFKTQLGSLPPCDKREPNPMYDSQPVKKPRKSSGPRPLTDYQKHMATCLKEKRDFETCRSMWKSGQGMQDEYHGSGYTRSKIRL